MPPEFEEEKVGYPEVASFLNKNPFPRRKLVLNKKKKKTRKNEENESQNSSLSIQKKDTDAFQVRRGADGAKQAHQLESERVAGTGRTR